MWGGIFLGVVLLASLAACGSSAGGSTRALVATLQATATIQPTATPTATVAPSPTASPTGSSSNDLLATGKLIFEETAGGVGCAYCHGLDGKGKGAPNIQGAEEFQVRTALKGVLAMSFIKLDEAELKAVVAYLQYLK